MKRVIVLQGVSGSGKSTYGRKIAAEFRANGLTVEIVSADDYFVRFGGGTYAFNPSHLPKAHGECFRHFMQTVGAQAADVVIVDNTNTTAVEAAPYMAGAQAFEYEAEIHRIVCDPEVAAARNLHGVPAGAVKAMASRIASEKLPPWWKLVVVTG